MYCIRCKKDRMKVWTMKDERYYRCDNCGCSGYARDSNETPELERSTNTKNKEHTS